MERNRIQWEIDLAICLEDLMEISSSEAQDILKLNDAYVIQEWNNRTAPSAAAQSIAEKLNQRKIASAENELLMVPVEGYVTDDQIKLKVAEMADLGFDTQTIGWAACAGIGDSKSIHSGNCTCVLIRMK